MEYNESGVYAASENLLALEALSLKLMDTAGLDLNFALESEILMGHNHVLENYFSNKSAAVRKAVATESVTEAIGAAFKVFIQRLIETFKKMIAWLTDKTLAGKSALKEVVLKAYNSLPALNYNLTWKFTLAGFNDKEAVSHTKALTERWEGKVAEWKLDLITGGDCMRSLEDSVKRFRSENFIGKFKSQFIQVQQWEEKEFHEAVDLDIALIRKTREEAQQARTEYKEKVSSDLDGAGEDISDFATYVADCAKEVKDCWDGAEDKVAVNVTTLKFNETTVLDAMRTISVEEFSSMRKEHAANLNGVVNSLDKVNTETANGENTLQHCVQAMRAAYTQRLTWLLRVSGAIQSNFEMISTAFKAMLEVEASYLRYIIDRIKLEITFDPENQEDWKEDFEAFKNRESALTKVMLLV